MANQPFILRFTIKQKRIELATNLYVDARLWDGEGQFVKGKTEEAQTINRRLALIKGGLYKKYLRLKALGKPHFSLKRIFLRYRKMLATHNFLILY